MKFINHASTTEVVRNGLQLVISEIPDSSAQSLLAVKLFAQYKSGQKSKVRSSSI